MRVYRKGSSFLFTCITLYLVFIICHAEDVDAIDDDLEKEAAAFARFEGQVVAFIKDARKKAYPFIARAIYDIDLPSMCSRSLTKLYNDAVALKSWALKLLDSNGKIGDGLMRGSISMLGDYDECLSIEVPADKKSAGEKVVGRYCFTFVHMPHTLLIHLKKFSLGKLTKTPSTDRFKEIFDLMSRYKFNGTSLHLRAGICIPSTCTKDTLQELLNYGFNDSGLRAEVRNCEVKGPYSIKVHQKVIFVLFGFMFAIAIIGTFLQLFHRDGGYTNGRPQNLEKKKIVGIFCHFSISSNTWKLFNNEFEEESYFYVPCLRGFVVLMFCFIIIVEKYFFLDEHVIRNFRGSMNYFDFIKDPLFAPIANALLITEVFFCFAGFSLFYHPNSGAEKSKQSRVITVIFEILRYILPLLVAIGTFLLFPCFGDGPAWHEVLDPQLSACRRNWWTNILFFNNFLKLEEQCLLPTWFLGCFIQLLLIGLLFKLLIDRYPIIGLVSLVLVTIMCNVALGLMASLGDLPPLPSMYFIFSKQVMAKVTENSYFMPHGHMGSFAVGIIAGFWKNKYPHFNIKPVWNYAIWVFIIIVISALTFGLYPYHDGRKMDVASLSTYAGVHGTVIGTVVALGLLSALNGKPGIFNRTLSSDYFLPLRKLIYLAALLHWPVIFFHIGISRERQYLNHYEQIFRSLSHITAVFIVAFLFFVIFNGFFTLDQVLSQIADTAEVKTVTCFKNWFSRKTFKVQPSNMNLHRIEHNFQIESHKTTSE